MTTLTSDDPVRLLERLIACPSVTPEEAGALDLLEAELTALGFAVTRLRFEGDGSYPVDNLFATRGTGGRRLLFAGHTDVVPPGDHALWASDPFTPRIDDGRIFGRGAADMKSGIAAFVAACAAIPADAGTIQLAITNDEEADAINGTEKLCAWMKDNGHAFDFAIVGEPSSAETLGDSIKIGRRGSFSGRVVVTGSQGHVAYPHKANNPLPVLAAVATALSSEKLDTGTEHFPASNLELTTIDVGNPVSNVIPASGSLHFNIRYNDLWTPDALADWIRGRIAGVDARGCTIDFAIAGVPSRSFLSPLSGDIDILSDAIEALTGRRPDYSTGGGTSDARFIAQYGPVVECGLVGPSMHKVDEHIAIADLTGLTEIYRQFITRFFGSVAR
ncbi:MULTISPECIES: succinyl-diaminopimelate desuccinylase [unclassified Devosia]|uniref:succinyl-diaminopimelate desuccinylase n=1 Tax=unclassified Devosia TaxID=196773 RepID=UPI0023D8B3C6|nr:MULTISPECIES: succinyl-diaminopimelate desuccinylase [unclassified Devosia]WEJ32652.1 succinyl-diaminopimelate desuccinylase [Devosia sp. SD17-2]